MRGGTSAPSFRRTSRAAAPSPFSDRHMQPFSDKVVLVTGRRSTPLQARANAHPHIDHSVADVTNEVATWTVALAESTGAWATSPAIAVDGGPNAS